MVGPRLEQQCGRADHHRLVRVRVRVRVRARVGVGVRVRVRAGGRVILACAFSGYFALQIEQCVLTADEPSGWIQRCRQLRCTNWTEPWHMHGLISGLSGAPAS